MRRTSNQFPWNKPERAIEWTLRAPNRTEQRKQLVQKWLEEAPYSKYRYHVETCDDGSKIYLVRPTRRHGLDFEVRLEGFRSKTRKGKSERPSHDDIREDLRQKLKAHPGLSEELFSAVSDVYRCIEVSEAIRRHLKMRSCTVGLPIDKILRVIKWLFIEQDSTYWLGTGRNMLMCGLEKSVWHMDSELYG